MIAKKKSHNNIIISYNIISLTHKSISAYQHTTMWIGSFRKYVT